MTIHEVSISELKPYEKNAKKHPEKQVEIIANSLREFGFKQPVVADKDGVIVAGHGRVLAAKKLGMETVPVLYADDLTEDQIKAFRLADNKTAESEWDFELLNFELEDIEMDMEQFGFEMEEDPDEKEIVEDDLPEEEEIETKCKPGDVWQIGNHRLICGDSTDKDCFDRLLDGLQADLIVTDPPYNVAIGDKNKHLNNFRRGGIMKNIQGDSGMTDEECGEVLWKPAFFNMLQHAKDDCSVYCFMPQGATHIIMMIMMKEAGWQVKHELIWVKNHFVLGFADYDYQHEPILYGWKKTHNFYAKEHQTSILEDDIDIEKLKKNELIDLLKEFMSEKYTTSVIREGKPVKNDLHPTMKPIKLLARLIRNSSKADDIVLDAFGGSGSTLIACEQLNRICYMCELDPHYCDVILQRYVNFVGSDKEVYLIKENGERIPYSEVK